MLITQLGLQNYYGLNFSIQASPQCSLTRSLQIRLQSQNIEILCLDKNSYDLQLFFSLNFEKNNNIEAMAGITSASSSSCCFPLVTRATTTKTTHHALCLSSLDSKLFGLRFHNPNLSKPDSLPCSSPGPVTTARFGGPRSYDSRRPRKSDSDDDQALNISSIR